MQGTPGEAHGLMSKSRNTECSKRGQKSLFVCFFLSFFRSSTPQPPTILQWWWWQWIRNGNWQEPQLWGRGPSSASVEMHAESRPTLAALLSLFHHRLSPWQSGSNKALAFYLEDWNEWKTKVLAKNWRYKELNVNFQTKNPTTKIRNSLDERAQQQDGDEKGRSKWTWRQINKNLYQKNQEELKKIKNLNRASGTNGTKIESLIFISLQFQERTEYSAEKVYGEIMAQNIPNLVKKLSKSQIGQTQIYHNQSTGK